MSPVAGTALAVAATTVAAGLAAAYTCNGSWFARAGALIVMVGVPLQVWEYMQAKDSDSMLFWKSDSDFHRVRAAIVALVCGTALQGFGDWLWLLVSPLADCP